MDGHFALRHFKHALICPVLLPALSFISGNGRNGHTCFFPSLQRALPLSGDSLAANLHGLQVGQ